MQARTSLRIAVCDDSPIFLNKTKTYIETWSANTGHAVQIFTYDNGDALIEAHKDCHMDIIFLDIYASVKWDGYCPRTASARPCCSDYIFDIITGICLRIL